MCDRVVVTPEPEPGGELQLETETGGGETSQYTVIDDIGVTQQSQSEILPEISFDAYGSCTNINNWKNSSYSRVKL